MSLIPQRVEPLSGRRAVLREANRQYLGDDIEPNARESSAGLIGSR